MTPLGKDIEVGAKRIGDYTNALPLSAAKEDVELRLVGTRCGRGLCLHLAAMGLRPGALIRVVRTHGPGPLIVAMGNTRMALGRGIAHHLFVVPIEDHRDS